MLHLLAEGIDPTTLIYGGPPVVVVLGILLAALIRVQRTYPKMYSEPIELLQGETKRQAKQIEVLERHVRECDYIVSLLIAALQEAHIEVPPQAWRRRRETDRNE